MKFLSVILMLAVFAAKPVFGTTYTYLPMVPSATDNTFIRGVSGSIAAGDFLSSTDNQEHGFAYNFDTHVYTLIDPAGSQSTTGMGIGGNNYVGTYSDGSNTISFLYNISTQVYTTINFPNSDSNSTTVTAASSTDVVGTYFGGGNLFGFVYDIGTKAYTKINPTGSSATNVSGISGNSVAGNYFNGNNNAGFVYNISTKAYTTFDISPGNDTHVNGISGTLVAGHTYSGGAQTGFIYNISTHSTTFYDPSGGRSTDIFAISGNNVVGNYFDGFEFLGFIHDVTQSGNTQIAPDPNGSDPTVSGVSGTNVAGYYNGSDNKTHGFLGYVANGSITLSGNLNPAYNGSTHGLTATTSPAGLTVTTTYQLVDSTGAALGAPIATAPTNAGRYAVVATVDDGTHMAMQTATLVISALPVTVTVGSLTTNYDGTPKSLTASASISGVSFTLHYSGTSNFFGTYPDTGVGETDGPPTNAGSYTGTAVINNPNYTLANPTTASGQLVINLAPQTVDLSAYGNLTVNDVITLPETTAAGLGINYYFLDSGNNQVTSTPFAQLTSGPDGNTDNILTILKKGAVTLYAHASGDPNHQPSDPPGEGINVSLDTAIMFLTNLSVAFDGHAHAATVTTNPSTLSADVALTYTDSQGHAASTAPSAVGKYAVSAVINDPNDMYQGSATGTMIIGQSFANWQTQHFTSTNPNVIGPAATPQGDSVPNLLKFLYDIDPSRPMSATDRAALPVVGTDTTFSPGNAYLTLTYRQSPLLVGATVNIQTSTGLQSWTTLTSSDSPPDMISRQVGTDMATGDPMMEVGVKMTGAPSQYIRINVTQP